MKSGVPGLIIQKRSNDILMVFMLVSKEKGKYDPLYLSNYATLNVLDELKRTKGVGDAIVFGGQDYSMRIWLRPDRMAQLGITTTDIAAAIRSQNAQYAAGKIGQEPAPADQQLIYTVNAKGRLLEPEQFGNIILRAEGRVALSISRMSPVSSLARRATMCALRLMANLARVSPSFLQPGANALETKERPCRQNG